MASKNIKKIITLNGNLITESHGAIPLDKVWIIKKFGAADVNMGDNKSTVFILKFGGSLIRALSLTGETQELEINHEITGDDIKLVEVQIKPYSSESKQVMYWIDAYQRN